VVPLVENRDEWGGLALEWRKRNKIYEWASPPQVLAMLEAYFDESGIHENAAICVIAGYFGYANHWRAQEKKWRKVLADFSFPLEDVHATELVSSHRHQPMLKKLAEAIAKSSIYPISAGIVVDDFYSFSEKQRKWMTGATLDEKTRKLRTSGSPNRPYYTPFQLCLKKITDYTRPGRKANFFFGLDRPMAKYAKVMFTQIKTEKFWPESDWATKRRLGDPAFPLAKETPQLQAADLFVHLVYQHMLERHNARNWNVNPRGLLATCLRNKRSNSDHFFQNKACLQGTLEKSYALWGNWDGH
jgi:hypothetical protein